MRVTSTVLLYGRIYNYDFAHASEKDEMEKIKSISIVQKGGKNQLLVLHFYVMYKVISYPKKERKENAHAIFYRQCILHMV